jgi:hypothetical protein
MSPCLAISTIFFAMASAPSSMAANATRVTRFLLPGGLPFGISALTGFPARAQVFGFRRFAHCLYLIGENSMVCTALQRNVQVVFESLII